MYSMAMNGWPSCSPTSKMVTMLGWRRRAAERASRANRSRSSSLSSRSSLIATWRSSIGIEREVQHAHAALADAAEDFVAPDGVRCFAHVGCGSAARLKRGWCVKCYHTRLPVLRWKCYSPGERATSLRALMEASMSDLRFSGAVRRIVQLRPEGADGCLVPIELYRRAERRRKRGSALVQAARPGGSPAGQGAAGRRRRPTSIATSSRTPSGATAGWST